MIRNLCIVVFALFSRVAFAALPAPLVVVTGGWDSCTSDGAGSYSVFGHNTGRSGVAFVNELSTYYSRADVNWAGMSDTGIRWLFSCFTKSSDLYLQGSEDDGVKLTGVWDLEPLMARIEKLSDGYRRPIFIIGHSHGGWLAIQLAKSLRRPIVAGFLTTIDPISFPLCNLATFADALLGLNPNGTATCRQAPGDVTAAAIQRIRTNLGDNIWRDYYQTNFKPMHSGEFEGPDMVLDMSPFFTNEGPAAGFNAHIRIASLSSIWYGLSQAFRKVYADAP